MGKESIKVQSVRGMMFNNSKWNHQFKGILQEGDPALYDAQSAAFGIDIGNEFSFMGRHGDIFNATKKGFDDYMAIQYLMFKTFKADQWDFNDKMIDDLQLDKYEIEEKLEGGSTVALVLDDTIEGEPQYSLFEYTEDWNKNDDDKKQSEKNDRYGRPLFIKLNSDINEHYNGAIIPAKRFVLMKDNPLKWNKIVENVAYFQFDYLVMCELHDNLYSGQDSFLGLTSPDWDPNAAENAQFIDDLLRSRRKFFSYIPKMGDSAENGSDPSDRVNNEMFKDFKDSIQKFELKDRIDILYNLHVNIRAEGYAMLGIPINSNEKKKERQITGEIDIQQAIPDSQRHGMFYCRHEAVRQANKKWSVGWEVTLKEEKEKEEQEDALFDKVEGE